MKNYYTILGISEDASTETIKEAYKKLARKFHPDVNPDDPFFSHWFKEINEAQRVLLDFLDRSEYDLKLSNYVEAYELMKPELKARNNNNFQERKPKAQGNFASRKFWTPILILAILAAGYLFFTYGESGSKHSEESGHLVAKFKIEDTAAPEKIPVSIRQMIPAVQVSVPVPGEHAKSDEEVPLPIIETKKKLRAAIKKTLEVQLQGNLSLSALPGKRALLPGEIDYILQQLRTHNKTCVQLIQSNNSNINNDFAIATVLQSHGFTIAGRKYTSGSETGLVVSVGEQCATLFIGTN